MADFKDHFSAVADGYRRFRPGYPRPLFGYLAEAVPRRLLAVDCGTGNGQAARALAPYFGLVCAADASADQLARAAWHPRVLYRRARAEALPVADASADLVTVGQAVHWFDTGRFFSEVRRVLRREGLIAVWSYGTVRVSAGVDAILDRLYLEILGDYWPPERRLVDAGLAWLALPFNEIRAPVFQMTECWTRDQFVGYLRTWSAVARFREDTGDDPVEDFERELAGVWPDSGDRRAVHWPFSLRLGLRA